MELRKAWVRSDKNSKDVCIVTNGCIECRMDCSLAEHFLQTRPGYRLCRDVSKADLVIFMGCAVNQEKEDLSCRIVKAVESLKKNDAHVLITGCIAEIRPDLVQNGQEFQDLVADVEHLSRFEGNQTLAVNTPYPEFWQMSDDALPQRTKDELTRKYCEQNPAAWLSRISPRWRTALINLFARYRRLIDREILSSSGKTFCIKVSTGCMGHCSYCSIKLARGRIKSKPIDTVVAEFERGLDHGYRDFALLGTDLGDYGKDRKVDLLDLLTRLTGCQEKFKLRLRNVNPRWLIPSVGDFCKLLQTGKIAYVLSPVESGSNRVLARMNRGYGIEDYIGAIMKVRDAYPPVFVKSQIMVGFPGETEDDFCKSMDLTKTGLFDYVDVYAYTKRPGTKAWGFRDEIDPRVISKRYRRLLYSSFLKLPFKRWLRLHRPRLRPRMSQQPSL